MVNGWLIIDKPSGITSTKVGSIIKHSLKIKKIGHIGTLDPLATGVLVFALGEATKLIPFLEKQYESDDHPVPRKTYEFEIRWGIATDTFDSDGEVTETTLTLPTLDQINKACLAMLGAQKQVPPQYSALKINGVRLYDLARKKITVPIKSRNIHIYSLQLKKYSSTSALFETECSQGTYIRSLAVDIAKFCSTLGHVTQLRRLKDGIFNIKQAIPLEKWQSLLHNYNVSEWMIPIGAVLGDIPAVSVLDHQVDDIYFGRPFLLNSEDKTKEIDESIVRILNGENLIGMGKINQDMCYPKRVLKP